MGHLVQGDLGNSLRYRARSVNEVIANNFPVSANLGLRALVFATVAGVALGIVAALNHDKGWDRFSIFIAVIGISVPNFIIAGLIQWLFGVKLQWLPVATYTTFAHTIMPTFALGLGTLAGLARYMRTSMLEVVGQDYIKTAKAKGLSPIQVTVKHQIRNALLPIVTILGPNRSRLTYWWIRCRISFRYSRSWTILRKINAKLRLSDDHGYNNILWCILNINESCC